MTKASIALAILMISAVVLASGCTQPYQQGNGGQQTTQQGTGMQEPTQAPQQQNTGQQQTNSGQQAPTQPGSNQQGTAQPPQQVTQAPQQGSKVDVAIQNFAFSPSTVTVHVGDTVNWTNEDSVTHTVTSDSGNELDSGPMPTNDMYDHVFTQPGTYTYHCAVHPMMKGTVIVQ